MNHLLIAVLSCQRDRNLGHHETIRQRWGDRLSDVGDVRFLIGGPALEDFRTDEIWFDVPDDYNQTSMKIKGVCAWMLERGYQHVFKCDCDTTIFVQRFRNYNCGGVDYAGRFWGGQPGERGLYAAGAGYFLSRRACEIILAYGDSSHLYEDVMVGNTLEPYIVSKEIKAAHMETSIYAALKGSGGPHEAAPLWVMIRRSGESEPVPCQAEVAERLISTGRATFVENA